MTKISPFELAQHIEVLQIEDNDYNCLSQTRFDVVNPILASTSTSAGTQTFDSYGKPKDSDSDKD